MGMSTRQLAAVILSPNADAHALYGVQTYTARTPAVPETGLSETELVLVARIRVLMVKLVFRQTVLATQRFFAPDGVTPVEASDPRAARGIIAFTLTRSDSVTKFEGTYELEDIR